MSNPMFLDYADQLQKVLKTFDWSPVDDLLKQLSVCWAKGSQVFIVGNGGSAANAQHIANDLLYGAGGGNRPGLRVEALTANTAVLTCLGNDVGYDSIFSEQLKNKARPGDVLIVLSGSGNSGNILKVLEMARFMSVKTFGILGFDGGKAKSRVDTAIHFNINDMQISEDMQLVVGHMLMKALRATCSKPAIHDRKNVVTLPQAEVAR